MLDSGQGRAADDRGQHIKEMEEKIKHAKWSVIVQSIFALMKTNFMINYFLVLSKHYNDNPTVCLSCSYYSSNVSLLCYYPLFDLLISSSICWIREMVCVTLLL